MNDPLDKFAYCEEMIGIDLTFLRQAYYVPFSTSIIMSKLRDVQKGIQTLDREHRYIDHNDVDELASYVEQTQEIIDYEINVSEAEDKLHELDDLIQELVDIIHNLSNELYKKATDSELQEFKEIMAKKILKEGPRDK